MRFLSTEKLSQFGIVHGFSLRNGGVSPFPLQSLNMDGRIDLPENVDENRRRFLTSLECPAWRVVTAHQVHSNNVHVVHDLSASLTGECEADAFITSLPGVFLGVKTADCLPILVADPVRRVVAAIHAGWRGTVAGVVATTINTMAQGYQTHPSDCWAVLGPCACERCYEVQTDVTRTFDKVFKDAKFYKWIKPNESAYLDLKNANRSELIRMGLKAEQIEVLPHCTIHQNQDFFSNRLEGQGNTVKVGRMLAVIGMRF